MRAFCCSCSRRASRANVRLAFGQPALVRHSEARGAGLSTIEALPSGRWCPDTLEFLPRFVPVVYPQRHTGSNLSQTKNPAFAGFLSGRRDSNSGPLVPQTSALTRLRHAPRPGHRSGHAPSRERASPPASPGLAPLGAFVGWHRATRVPSGTTRAVSPGAGTAGRLPCCANVLEDGRWKPVSRPDEQRYDPAAWTLEPARSWYAPWRPAVARSPPPLAPDGHRARREGPRLARARPRRANADSSVSAALTRLAAARREWAS